MPDEKVYRSLLTPISFLRRSACIYPNKTAVVHGGRRYTYARFEERVNRLASRLRQDGLQKYDRVAFVCPNIPAMLEAHFAIPAAGGILVTVNTRLNSAEIGYILGHCGARWVFADAECMPLLGSSALVVVDEGAAMSIFNITVPGGLKSGDSGRRLRIPSGCPACVPVRGPAHIHHSGKSAAAGNRKTRALPCGL